ncbi:MAG: hypothetical protein GX594_00025 [Pirellulaceae bacterium]|nr:hypothetical protein [Pirellulaceae bacterium]
MQESKIELTERLRREDRWGEASKRKDEIIRLLRADGMKRAEASEEGWRRIAAEYPPLPEPEAEETTPIDAEGDSMTPTPYPASWGLLPHSAKFEDEVDWVHQNRAVVVEERPGCGVRVHWDRARRPAPSYGAISLMEFSCSNRKGFMDILARLRPAENEKDEANIQREKMSIGEIREILKQFNERRDEALLADAHQGVRDRVGVTVDDWARRFGLTVPKDAQAALETLVAELVHVCGAVSDVESAENDASSAGA